MGERRRYLSILGLNDGASDEDIRKAYKKLALQYHPDKNESDDAKGKFQEISNAYTFLTEGPKGFDGLHHGHANDIRAELFRRMFEEMFFPSFAFRGPRAFPFVFVDSDSDDDYYYFDDDDDDESSSDDGFVFSGYGGGHRTFQNRYPGPKRPTTPQYEPSKKQQRKREKRQRQRERARERKAQTQDEKKRSEQQKSQNKNDGYPSQGEQKSTDNQSGKDSQKSAESQSGGNSQEENQPETGNGSTCRSETPNLSRPSTPLESQQNPQKLTKKQRKKLEAEQRKRDQEMKEIAAELLKKQEKEKEKQKEREKKSEQRESEEKENEEVFGWFDTKKKSRKARQREKRRQEAMSTPDPTEAKQDNGGLADAEDGEGEGTASGNDPGANDGIPNSTRSPREPLKNVPEINKSSVKPASRPRDAGSQSSQQRSIRRNGPPSNVKSGRIFVNSTQRTANKNQNQNNAGPPGFRMTGRPLSNKYDILDDFDDLNLNNHDDTSDDDSDSEVEEITSQNIHRHNQSKPLFHAPDKGHNDQQKTSAKGDNPRINTSNNSQSGKSQSSISQNGRGAGINQTRGGYHGNQVGGTPNQQGRGGGVKQTRGGYSGKQNGAFDQKFNRQQENDFRHGGGTFSRGGYTFSGFQNKPTGYSTQYFEPVFRHDAPFDPGFRDYGYHAYESRPYDYGPPSFNCGPPTFSGGSYYGGPCFAPQFDGDMYSQPGPSAFQRGPVRGGPPGFQTGARRGGGRENFGQKPNYPFEAFSDLKGNRPTFPRNEFKPDGGARVSSQGNYYNHGNTRKMGSSPVNREVDSPVFGASSGSGASLDSLDDFCPEQGTNVAELNGEKVKSTVSDRGVGFEGLIGLSELGVPKGLFGDRVKNYYS